MSVYLQTPVVVGSSPNNRCFQPFADFGEMELARLDDACNVLINGDSDPQLSDEAVEPAAAVRTLDEPLTSYLLVSSSHSSPTLAQLNNPTFDIAYFSNYSMSVTSDPQPHSDVGQQQPTIGMLPATPLSNDSPLYYVHRQRNQLAVVDDIDRELMPLMVDVERCTPSPLPELPRGRSRTIGSRPSDSTGWCFFRSRKASVLQSH